MNFDVDAIPSELREREQWVCWKTGVRNGNETKIPMHPSGTGNAKSNDMATWGTFEQAVSTARDREGWGIGFMFSDADPYLGIDLDGCVRYENGNGKGKDWLPSLDVFGDTYIEYSPSGDGLHIILKDTDLPDWWTNQKEKLDGEERGIEVYDSSRYFTFTGDALKPLDVGTVDGLDGWLLDGWEVFNDDLPDRFEESTESANSDLSPDIDVFDVVSRGSHPGGKRSEHPFHGSETGANFLVDENGETFRCWRHGVTGNAHHLLGIETGVISCGDWKGTGLDSDTWRGIYDRAREAGYDIPEPSSPSSNTPVTEAAGFDDDATDAYQSLHEEIQTKVVDRFENDDDYTRPDAIHETALILTERRDWVRPRSDTFGWQSRLYNYVPEEGIYEPHGKAEVSVLTERTLGPLSSNKTVGEVTGKIERLTRTRERELAPDPARLAVGNGILELTTGQLGEYDPDEYHRVRLPWNYREGAECPAIDEFFRDIVDEDDVPKLYRLIAHSLYKGYPAEKAAMLLGGGRNGKSLFLELFEEFLGKWNVAHQPLKKLNEKDWSPARLLGKLANTVPDMSDQSVDTMQTFKGLTGRDTLEGDVKYEEPVQFENHATLMFACNQMPVLHDDTRGNWRRWMLIKFPYTFDDNDPTAKDETPKRELLERLTQESELEGLLARCVEEINRWYNGEPWFPNAPDWETTRSQMRRAAEPVFDFADTCLEAGDGEDTYVAKGTVRAAYNKYATREGLSKLSREQLGERLLGLSDYTVDSTQRRVDGDRPHVYTGIELSVEGKRLLGLLSDEGDETGRQQGLEESGPRHREETVYGVIDNHTGGGLPDTISTARVKGLATKQGLSPEQVDDALKTLVEERGRVIETVDGLELA